MDILMIRETKGNRVYFRVAQNFKREFMAAAMAREQDPSEAFRVIARKFIETVRLENPERFAEQLERLKEENHNGKDATNVRRRGAASQVKGGNALGIKGKGDVATPPGQGERKSRKKK